MGKGVTESLLAKAFAESLPGSLPSQSFGGR
jgi:hypothetical protein